MIQNSEVAKTGFSKIPPLLLYFNSVNFLMNFTINQIAKNQLTVIVGLPVPNGGLVQLLSLPSGSIFLMCQIWAYSRCNHIFHIIRISLVLWTGPWHWCPEVLLTETNLLQTTKLHRHIVPRVIWSLENKFLFSVETNWILWFLMELKKQNKMQVFAVGAPEQRDFVD